MEGLKEVKTTLHRHIGGLENISFGIKAFAGLHRHIGGLEKMKRLLKNSSRLHRHIGGLEIWEISSAA